MYLLTLQKVDHLCDEIRSLQSKLSEVSSTTIQQGEKLREVRRGKRKLDQENADLNTKLKHAQVWINLHVYMCKLVSMYIIQNHL